MYSIPWIVPIYWMFPQRKAARERMAKFAAVIILSFVFHADVRKWTNTAIRKTLEKENPTQHKTMVAALLHAKDPETKAGLTKEQLVFGSTGFMYGSTSNLFDC